MSFPLHRPRRLRRSAAMRRLVAETRLHPAELILPAFIKEGAAGSAKVTSMPKSANVSVSRSTVPP